jgi:hypothetical protein
MKIGGFSIVSSSIQRIGNSGEWQIRGSGSNGNSRDGCKSDY